MQLTTTVEVFLFALLTAVATGIGALPFVFVKDLTRSWLGASNAVAAGLMLSASFGLVYEGVRYGLLRTLVGALTGLVFIVLVRRFLQRDEHPAVFAQMTDLDARKALLIVGVMTMHSFTEGVGLGVSFGGGIELGLFITLAIAVHNIPEGLAISLVLVPRGCVVEQGGLLERLLQSAATPYGCSGIRLRRDLQAFVTLRTRIRSGGYDLDGLLRAHARRPG